jgi:hypothetical protein
MPETLGTAAASPAPLPICKHCHVSGRRLYEDGGTYACERCIDRLTAAAFHPERLSIIERREFALAHRDVVQLVLPSTDGRAFWLPRGVLA